MSSPAAVPAVSSKQKRARPSRRRASSELSAAPRGAPGCGGGGAAATRFSAARPAWMSCRARRARVSVLSPACAVCHGGPFLASSCSSAWEPARPPRQHSGRGLRFRDGAGVRRACIRKQRERVYESAPTCMLTPSGASGARAGGRACTSRPPAAIPSAGRCFGVAAAGPTRASLRTSWRPAACGPAARCGALSAAAVAAAAVAAAIAAAAAAAAAPGILWWPASSPAGERRLGRSAAGHASPRVSPVCPTGRRACGGPAAAGRWCGAAGAAGTPGGASGTGSASACAATACGRGGAGAALGGAAAPPGLPGAAPAGSVSGRP